MEAIRLKIFHKTWGLIPEPLWYVVKGLYCLG
jgi:hypothetical protein